MYALGLGYLPTTRLIEELAEKKLIMILSPEEAAQRRRRLLGGRSRRWKDGRTRDYIEITVKGQYVLRWLDALLKYIDDTADPQILPPLWALRTLFRGRVEDAFDPFASKPTEFSVSGLRFRLPPPSVEDHRALRAKFVVSTYRIIHKGYQNMPAIFTVMSKPELFCPKCGRRSPDLRGLKIHISKSHPDERGELFAAIKVYLKLKP
jgi:hypothetical protein